MKAFPQKYPINASYSHHAEHNPIERGMELRDYFACAAMQSFLSFQDVGNMTVAKEAYMMADAMMEARNDNK